MYFIIGADKKEYGPVSGDEIHHWIRERRANGQTLARSDDQEAWSPLSEFPEFASILPSANAPMIPKPLEQRGQTFEARDPETSQRAIASLILGIASATLCCWCPFMHPIAITLGGVAISDINERPDQLKGKGLAIAGILLSLTGLLLFAGIQVREVMRLMDSGQFPAIMEGIQP